MIMREDYKNGSTVHVGVRIILQEWYAHAQFNSIDFQFVLKSCHRIFSTRLYRVSREKRNIFTQNISNSLFNPYAVWKNCYLASQVTIPFCGSLQQEIIKILKN